MNLFAAVVALVLSLGVTGCGIEFIDKTDRSDGQKPANSETLVSSKVSPGRITVTMDENDSSARQVKLPSQKPVAAANPGPSPIATPDAIKSVTEVGSCLVQADDFSGSSPLTPFMSSSSTREFCAQMCNSNMMSVKFFAGNEGCSYSCEWNAINLVPKFSNAKSCTVAVATLK